MSGLSADVIKVYTCKHYPDVKPARQKVRQISLVKMRALKTGHLDGKRAALHRPVNQDGVLRLE